MTTSANEFYRDYVSQILKSAEAANEFHKRLCQLPEKLQEEIRGMFKKKFPESNLHLPLSGDPKSPNELKPRFSFLTPTDAFKDPEPVNWVIEGLFSEGSVSIVFGEPGAKKTYAMLDACVCVALGKPWLGHEVRQGRVLFIDEESGPGRFARRIRQAINGHQGTEDTPMEYLTLESFELGKKADVDLIITEINQRNVDLVVIDALVDVTLGADENSSQEMGPMMSSLKTMGKKTGAAFVVVHHSNKNGRYRGSSALKGAVDLLLKVNSEKQNPLIKFETIKARDTEAVDFAARANFSEESFFLESADPSEFTIVKKLGAAESYVLKTLAANGDMLRKDILAYPDGCSEPSARNAIYALSEKKLIHRIDEGARGTEATFGLTESGLSLCKKSGWLTED